MTAPRKGRNTEALSAAASSLGSNLGDEVPREFLPEELADDTLVLTTAKNLKPKKEVPPEQAVKTQPRLWIVLEDNDDIPPGGQFIGVDGAAFNLLPNEEAWVPVGITSVLDAAIKSVPVQDNITKQIVGWKNRLRFPYRIIRDKQPPKGWVQPK